MTNKLRKIKQDQARNGKQDFYVKTPNEKNNVQQ